MKVRSAAAAALVRAVAALAGCSFENKYEREADKITHAVMNNDLSRSRTTSHRASTSRASSRGVVRRAERAGQARVDQRERYDRATPGFHCFDVKFEKRNYLEELAMDDQGKVTQWRFQDWPMPPLSFTDVVEAARSHSRRRAPHADVDVADVQRAHRRAALLQVRELAAHGCVQVSRRLQSPCAAFAGRSGARGVVAYSSGNHAQGVALAAQLLGYSGDDRDAARCARE